MKSSINLAKWIMVSVAGFMSACFLIHYNDIFMIALVFASIAVGLFFWEKCY